jgi:hypothetical protein
MWLALILGFASGVLGANGVPHFVKGIVKERFPTPVGGSPVINLAGGWLMFVGAGICLYAAGAGDPVALCGLAVGCLAMGMFHATVGALGRSD